VGLVGVWDGVSRLLGCALGRACFLMFNV